MSLSNPTQQTVESCITGGLYDCADDLLHTLPFKINSCLQSSSSKGAASIAAMQHNSPPKVFGITQKAKPRHPNEISTHEM